MTNLTLNDGTVIPVLETSTPLEIKVSGNLTLITTALEAITTDNLKNATLGNTTLVNKVYVGVSGGSKDGEYTFTFALRDKTENELLRQDIDDANAALMELAEMIGG